MNNDWRNARIEEAAKAIQDAWITRGSASPGEVLRWEFKADAEAALAVFEKALGEATVTPTDDERGALTNKATTPDGRLEHHLLEGEAVTMYPYWAADLRTVIAGFRRSVVSEPSDDDYPDAEGLAMLRSQGEPSDAILDAAMKAAKDYAEFDPYAATDREMMRAALRAASAVTERGENR